MLSTDEDLLYVLPGAFKGVDDALQDALEKSALPDEIVFGGLSDAYHRDIRLYEAVSTGRVPPPIAAVVFLDLSLLPNSILLEIDAIREYFPKAVFVLYGSPDEYASFVRNCPREWSDRMRLYYRLDRQSSNGLPSSVRAVLDRARVTAIKKRDEHVETRKTIFVSYAREDHEIANRLAFWLRTDGYRVWLDDRSLVAGDDWLNAIRTALRESHLLVLVVSEFSLNSDYVKFEYSSFLDQRKPVVPVLIDDACQMPRELQALHHAKMSPQSPYETYPLVLQAVARHLGDEQQEPH